MFVAQSKLQCV